MEEAPKQRMSAWGSTLEYLSKGHAIQIKNSFPDMFYFKHDKEYDVK